MIAEVHSLDHLHGSSSPEGPTPEDIVATAYGAYDGSNRLRAARPSNSHPRLMENPQCRY